MKANYIQGNDDAFNAQLQAFKNNIGPYATALGLITGQVSAQAADALSFNYNLQCQVLMQNSAQQWTAWKDVLRNGGPGSGAVTPAPVVFPTAVPPVPFGIEVRFRALVKLIKASVNYNATVGEALGIEGAQQTGPDLTTVQPQIAAVIVGNHVNVKWGWGGNGAFLDICELQVDRADGKGFVLLAYDTTPGYTDTQPFPAAPVIWNYRAIYRVGDNQVGIWSNPVSVTVPG